MEYSLPCGCIVKVTEDTLEASVDYCEQHRAATPGAVTELGKQISDIVAEADNLANTFSQNLNTMVAEGTRIVRMLQALKGEKEDDEQDDQTTSP